MTSIGTAISWTRSSWNPSAGCHPVSAGCDNCYAAAMFQRTGLGFGHAFEDVKLHPERLDHVRRFKPWRSADGMLNPHLVFVNSISDLMHAEIPDLFVHQVFDAMEQAPDGAVFQLLSKRPARMRKILVDRYKGRGLPASIWIGFSVESNEVAARLNVLRKIRDALGEMTTFVSVEPIIGETDKIDFEGISWVITGGESGARARVMRRSWLIPAISNAKVAGAALWHKQSGTVGSHPNISEAPGHLGVKAQFAHLVEHGWELLPEEKGGGTVDRRTWREFPPAYHAAADRLNSNTLI